MRNKRWSIIQKVVCTALFLAMTSVANLATAFEKSDESTLAIAPNATQIYILNYYSPWTSDENPPYTCQNKYLTDFMQCSGSYCDKIAVGCEYVAREHASNYWTSYFSEEGTHNRICRDSTFMTGFHCKGSNCDKLSIQCATVTNTTRGACYWTGWFSEEIPSWKFTAEGYYAAGLSCSGRYCDNKNIYACEML